MEQQPGNTRKAVLFVGLTYGVSWTFVGLYFALGGKWEQPWTTLLGVAYMFVPLMAALVVQRIIYRQPVARPLGISFRLNWWWLLAWLVMPVLTVATLGVSLLFPGVSYDPHMTAMLERMRSVMTPEQYRQAVEQVRILPLLWMVLGGGMLAGITVNAVAGFGEEAGWRGLLQRELGHLGFWRSSFVIGAVWGIWHFPLILKGWNYPDHPVLGVAMMTAWTILLAPLFSFVRLRTGSVIGAAILHGTLNGVAGAAIMLVRGGSDLTVGMTGLAGFVVLAFVNIAIYLCNRACPLPEGASALSGRSSDRLS